MHEPNISRFWLFMRMLADAKAYWGHIALIFAVSIASGLIALLAPVSLKLVVDNAIGGKPLSKPFSWLVPQIAQGSPQAVLLFACGLAVFVLVLQAVQNNGLWVYQTYVADKIVRGLRVRLFNHVQRLSVLRHNKQGAPDLLYRLQNDVANVQGMFGLVAVAASFVSFAFMFAVIWRLDYQLSLLVLAVMPLMFAVNHWYMRKSRALWKKSKESDQLAVAVMQEVLDGIQVVKAFVQESNETRRFREKAEQNSACYLKAISMDGIFVVAVSSAIAVASAVTLYVGASHVLSGALSLGSFFLIIAYMAQLYKPLEVSAKQVIAVQSSLVSAERVYFLLDQAHDVADGRLSRRLSRSKGAIEFQNVSFSYYPGQRLIENLSFSVRPGQHVGISGPSGTGKTTLISLFNRFVDPDSGRILLDGADLRQYRIADLRRQFAFVIQEPFLFSGSVAQNISYARPEASMPEIRAAAEAAGAHDFISALSDGYETVLGEKGKGLSGGERQRISIARAFLLDAPVLILDEPTSSIDSAKEASIIEALGRLQRGRTAFIISHRPSLFGACDFMLEFSARVAEEAGGA